MPALAYKGDQLKKNPMLGTTLNLESRTDDRKRFKRLYDEARASRNKGREGMKRALSKRAKAFSEKGEGTLGSLRRRYASTQDREEKLYTSEHRQKVMNENKKSFFGEFADHLLSQEMYEKDVARQVGRLREEGKELASEYDRRQHNLQQHINDYNLFLGSY